MLENIRPRNILSFGPDTEALELGRLNVLIGANASGKSNLLETLGLLRASPGDLSVPIREGGGIGAWLWKGGRGPVAEIEVQVRWDAEAAPINHRLLLAASGHSYHVLDERVEGDYAYFEYKTGSPTLRDDEGRERVLSPADWNPKKSILAQRRDPDHYPQITGLSEWYEGVRFYRDWSFGPNAPARRAQSADLPAASLAEDCSNLALVLSGLRREPEVKQRILADLRLLFEGVTDYEVIVEAGTAQLYLNENNRLIPATRLSDGTIRFLCLLSVFHHPRPAPLVLLEEPELGLHPDILPRVAELLREASTRMQVIVTTHSDSLVDALSDQPEVVIVVEKVDGATRFTRLDTEELEVWLRKYSLGELWVRGEIGGTRW